MPRTRLLDPSERFAEILFGLLMVLTFTGTLSVATAGHHDVREMLIGALGCNLAWGIVDGVMYLINTLTLRMRGALLLRELRAATPERGREIVTEALPDGLVELLGGDELEAMRRRLSSQPAIVEQLPLRRNDFLAALGVFLLVFLATFPVAIPFMVVQEVTLAKRLSNAVALVMLYVLGHRVGLYTAWRPWLMGLSMLALGGAMVAIIIALGG